MNVIALGAQLGMDLARFGPGRLLTIALLSTSKSLLEGATFALMVPLLAFAGRSASAGATSLYSAAIEWIAGLAGTSRAVELLLAILLLVLLTRAAVAFALSRHTVRFHADFVNSRRQALYTAHSRANWLYLARTHHAHDIHALTGQADYVGSCALQSINIVASTFTVAVGIGVAFSISPRATGIVVAGILLLALPLLAFQRHAFEQGTTVMHALQSLQAALHGRMGGLKLGKAFACERELERQFAVTSTAYRDALVHSRNISTTANMLYDVGAAALLIGLVLVSNQLTTIATIELAVLVIVFMRLAPLANGIVSEVRSLAAMLPDYAAIHRMEAAARAEGEVLPNRARRIPMRVGLELRNVGVTYPDANDAWALREISHYLKAGTATGILGRSGAGKSTLADTIAGLIAPAEGEVVIDGEPLLPERRTDWRASISHVPQDAPLFHDTIRNNLRIGAPDASDEEISECLRAVYATSLVATLPSGLDTLAGERGIRLSGGERQRLRLASALLRKPEMLILDEALNALNPADEVAIIANLRRMAPMTIVVIAHRASSLMWTDHLLVVDGGRIVDQGPPTEVAKRHIDHL